MTFSHITSGLASPDLSSGVSIFDLTTTALHLVSLVQAGILPRQWAWVWCQVKEYIVSTAWLCRSQQWLYTGCKDNRVLKRVSEVSELTLSRMAREEHFDCLVIGAGISGLDAAYHIQKHARCGLFE